jgi:FeS assembly protein IscX
MLVKSIRSPHEASKMKWTDTLDIAMALAEAHPDVDPATIRFTELRRCVLALPGFDDDPAHSGERILEAIQQAWIEELQ